MVSILRALIPLLILIGGCSSDPSLYKNNTPILDHQAFFTGDICAWGTVHDYSGSVTRRFVADIKGTATDTSFELDEIFLFDDGEKQERLWKFNKTADGWEGRAGDVAGVADGQFIGNMMALKYDLQIKTDDSEIIIAMDDELHLVDENNLMGKTIMTKFGITVGEINLIMQKQLNGSACKLERN